MPQCRIRPTVTTTTRPRRGLASLLARLVAKNLRRTREWDVDFYLRHIFRCQQILVVYFDLNRA